MLSLVAKKIGMSHIYDEAGAIVPLTMVQLYDNCVVDLTVNQDKDFDSLLIGFDKVEKTKKVAKSVAGVFTKKNIPVHKKIYGCQIKKGSSYKAGDVIAFDSVVKEGDNIDVTGYSIGKGFAGVMKRHNFRGLEASHGVSVSHRSHGSTGQRQDPGKVFKGKKMAGHMGVDKVTVKNLKIVMVDKDKKLIAIKGAIPGNAGVDVVLKIAG
jgi:large subunit ribosomal protein L3